MVLIFILLQTWLVFVIFFISLETLLHRTKKKSKTFKMAHALQMELTRLRQLANHGEPTSPYTKTKLSLFSQNKLIKKNFVGKIVQRYRRKSVKDTSFILKQNLQYLCSFFFFNKTEYLLFFNLKHFEFYVSFCFYTHGAFPISL